MFLVIFGCSTLLNTINRYNRADINQHYMERDSVQNIKIEHSKRKGVSSFVLSNDTPLLRVL